MVGEIKDGVLIGGSGVVDAQFVLIGQRVDHLGSQVARTALFAIFADIGQFQRLPMTAGDILGRPQTLVEALQSAVQRVVTIVLGDVVGRPIEDELSVSDAIGVAADDGAEKRFVGEVAVELVVAQNDILNLAASVGYFQ